MQSPQHGCRRGAGTPASPNEGMPGFLPRGTLPCLRACSREVRIDSRLRIRCRVFYFAHIEAHTTAVQVSESREQGTIPLVEMLHTQKCRSGHRAPAVSKIHEVSASKAHQKP